MTVILQKQRAAMHFGRLSGAKENSFAFFSRRWRRHLWHPMSISGAERQHRENKMKQLLKLTATPAAALFALAFVAMATPASAGEYCRQDVTSGMRSCSFETLAQCQSMSAGRGGDCYRDPFLADPSNALAYQPKQLHSQARVLRGKTPVENQ
jgi:hypothetical protein